MKKILLILLVLLIPFKINAATYDADISGVKVVPTSTSGSGKSCTAKNYYVGFYTQHYVPQGIRVTFYDNENNQVGNTVDVWVWGPLFMNNYVAGSRVYKKISQDNGFAYYSKETNHSRYYYSRIDYSNGKKFELNGGKYYFYYDQKAMEESVITSNVVKSGPLFYSLQGADKPLLRKYLTDSKVMKRYMKIAKAEELLDVEIGNYVMVIEPVVFISSCVDGTYSGAYTSTEVGKLWSGKSIGINNTLKTLPGWLALSQTTTIAGVTYKKTDITNKDGSPRLFNGNEFAGNTGAGISVIYGTEVCEPNCKDPDLAYKIIYRVIDLANPFLGLNGKKRTLSSDSNWYEKESTIDARIYEKKPIYTVTLKPSVIKKIREDNKKVNYAKILASYSAGAKFKDSKFKKKFGL